MCHVDCLGSAVVAKLVEVILRKEVIEVLRVLFQLAKSLLTVFIRRKLIDLWIDQTSYRCSLLSDFCHIIMGAVSWGVAYKSRNRVKAFRYLEILELDLILLRGSVAHPTYDVSPLRSSEATNDSSNPNLDESLLLGKEELQC